MKQQRNAAIAKEWLDGHPRFPIIFLILLPFLVELPLLFLGLNSDPLYVGGDVAYHSPVGHTFAGVNPRATTIDGNIGGQLQALGHLSASEWIHGRIPWWNHYSGTGLPLAGEMQPASFFLPFILLLLLKNGILWLTIAMQIVAGLATFALLRTLDIGRLAALTGGALFSMNGTFALLSGMVGNTVPFLPLLVYGIELAYRHGSAGKGALWIGLSLFFSLAAGFPESAYLNGLFALTWTLYRFSGSSSKSDFAKTVVYGGTLGLMLCSPLLVAFFDYVKTTDIVAIHRTDYAILKPAVLANIFLPYVFGSIYYAPAPNWNVLVTWGSNGGYESIVIAFVALLGLQAKKERGLRWVLALWIIVCLSASFGIPPFHRAVRNLPFMKDVNLSRYSSATWELAFTILAAMALDDLKQVSLSKWWPFAVAVAIIAVCCAIAWPGSKFWGWQPHEAQIMKSLMYTVAGLAFLSLIALLAVLHFGKSESGRYAVSAVLVCTASWTFMVPETAALKNEPDDLPGVTFIQEHLGLSRFFSMGPIQPNYPAYFQIPSLNYAYCPVAKEWASYVEHNLFPDIAKTAGGAFVPGGWFSYAWDDGQTALTTYGNNYKNAAVRYIVARPGESILSSISIPQKESSASQLTLEPGQTIRSTFHIPEGKRDSYPLSIIGVLQGKYARPEVMSGDIQLTACLPQSQCVSGRGTLAFSHPEEPIWIPLENTLNLHPGDELTVSLTYLSGTIELVVSMASDATLSVTSITPSGQATAGIMQLRLAYGDGMARVRPVYSDRVMDIWELPDAAPYYSVVDGPCTVSNETLDSVDAECASAATLLRREYYMKGWRARLNGVSIPVSATNSVFQSISLQPGKNSVRFEFSPPHVQFAWPFFWISFMGLIWELRKYLGRPPSKLSVS